MQHSFLSISPNTADEKALRIHYVAEKPENAKGLIIFLHGFSQFWYVLKPYLEYFSSKGFHVVAPDMQGFNDSDKPDAKSSMDEFFSGTFKTVHISDGSHWVLQEHFDRVCKEMERFIDGEKKLMSQTFSTIKCEPIGK